MVGTQWKGVRCRRQGQRGGREWFMLRLACMARASGFIFSALASICILSHKGMSSCDLSWLLSVTWPVKDQGVAVPEEWDHGCWMRLGVCKQKRGSGVFWRFCWWVEWRKRKVKDDTWVFAKATEWMLMCLQVEPNCKGAGFREKLSSTPTVLHLRCLLVTSRFCTSSTKKITHSFD